MVNQTRLVELAVGQRAVPTPSLALGAQRGASPGLPGAGRGLPFSAEGRAHATKRLSSFATGGAIAAAQLTSRGCDVFCLVIMVAPCQIRISANVFSPWCSWISLNFMSVSGLGIRPSLLVERVVGRLARTDPARLE